MGKWCLFVCVILRKRSSVCREQSEPSWWVRINIMVELARTIDASSKTERTVRVREGGMYNWQVDGKERKKEAASEASEATHWAGRRTEAARWKEEVTKRSGTERRKNKIDTRVVRVQLRKIRLLQNGALSTEESKSKQPYSWWL